MEIQPFFSSISASHTSLKYDTHPFPLLHKFQSCSSKFFKSMILYLIAGNVKEDLGSRAQCHGLFQLLVVAVGFNPFAPQLEILPKNAF